MHMHGIMQFSAGKIAYSQHLTGVISVQLDTSIETAANVKMVTLTSREYVVVSAINQRSLICLY